MILAGIDEAGYGPLLGPLVVGCCAFQVDDGSELPVAPADPLPCLWKRLTKLVSRNRTKTGRKLHVNDSKQVYSPSVGLRELERSIVCMMLASGRLPAGFSDFLGAVAPQAMDDLGHHPWYAPAAGETFPFEQDVLSLSLFSKALEAEMTRTGTRCVHLAAQVLPERKLNAMLEQTRNKASVLFSVAAVHLDYLLKTFGRQGLVIYCDRQGGREHYGQLLRLMFEDWPLEILREHDGHSEYMLHHPKKVTTETGQTPPPVRIVFREKGEEHCMSVALASMLSKYLREGLMRRFNAFWRQYLPDVAPTAGYYGDGQRFLQDIDAKRRELGIRDELLIRAR
jgi:hypothetical protein